MFKNAIAYRLTGQIPSAAEVATRVATFAHREPGPLEAATIGFVPVLGDQLAYECGQLLLLAVRYEKKVIPAYAVSSRLQAYVAEAAEEEAREVGPSERRAQVRKIRETLCAGAYTSATTTKLLIDRHHGWLLVDSASSKRAEVCISRLRQALDTFPCKPFNDSDLALALTLSKWAEGAAPTGVTVDDDVQWSDGAESVVRAKGRIDQGEIERLSAHRVATHLRVTLFERLTCTIRADQTLRRLVWNIAPDADAVEDAAGALSADVTVFGNTLMETFSWLAGWCTPANGGSAGAPVH